jgi:FkbM family methyltransferase
MAAEAKQTMIARKAALRVKRGIINGWSAARPRFHVPVAGRQLSIPATPTTGWILSWQPDWKTEMIGKMLGQRLGVFIDVGANIGQTLLDYCASPARKGYIGFEPSALCVDHLQRIIDANRLLDCTVYPMALAHETGPLKFYVHGPTDPGASLVRGIEPSRPAKTIIVPAYRFDDIAESVTSEPISLIKIDVEGAEDAVIEGMSETIRRERPPIICEVLARDPSADPSEHSRRTDRIMRLLQNLGYGVSRIDKSDDRKRVVGLTPMDHFPTEPFSSANASQCDYLFA